MNELEWLGGGAGVLIQDGGRPGFRRHGVAGSGACDGTSLALANRLLGNADQDAALEFNFCGGRLVYRGAAQRAAWAGGDARLFINDLALSQGRSFTMRNGDRLHIQRPREHIRSYLAFAGGLSCEPQLGSLATHSRAALGGLDGSALKTGDRIALNGDPASHDSCLELPWQFQKPSKQRIRLLPGPQADSFASGALATFCAAPWQIDPLSDRVGYRLNGASPTYLGPEMISDPVLPGCIQIPPSGQPLVLMADGPTTGGYPKIACILSTDLGMLAQKPPGSIVLFQQVSLEQAANAEAERQAWLRAAGDAMLSIK